MLLRISAIFKGVAAPIDSRCPLFQCRLVERHDSGEIKIGIGDVKCVRFYISHIERDLSTGKFEQCLSLEDDENEEGTIS